MKKENLVLIKSILISIAFTSSSISACSNFQNTTIKQTKNNYEENVTDNFSFIYTEGASNAQKKCLKLEKN